MNDEKRDELRALQDEWLRRNAGALGNTSEDTPIAAGGPTLRQVRECLVPAWEWWFRDELSDGRMRISKDIPVTRDLLAHAKLLECLGRVTTLLDEAGGSLPAHFEDCTPPGDRFATENDEENGGLYCTNYLLLTDDDEEIGLWLPREYEGPWPLVFFDDVHDSLLPVLTREGNFTAAFLDELRRRAEEGPRD